MKRTTRQFWAGLAACSAAALWFGAAESRGEAILQVFNQSHNEIAARLPEIAEAGYTALWVPPPTKANGGMSVGYDLNDPFDIGNSDLRGTWSTRYGVEADLHNLIAMCHRFGMRVYFDNVMNHRSYDIPGYNESTPTDVYPGMCPEDFHVRTTSDGFYRKWDNVRSWDDEWQVMFLGLSDLLDIAHENYYIGDSGPYNANFGPTEGGWHLKPYIVRYAYHKEDTWKLFDRMPYPGKTNDDYRQGDGSLQNTDGDNGRNLYTGFENRSWNPDDPATAALIEANAAWFDEHDARNGVSMKLIEDFPNFYKEQVDDYLNRAVRWLVDKTKVDGLRLDAVKHVPYDFYGASWGDDKDGSNYGYMGQAQWQFNMTRGFQDWDNHRDSVFNIDAPRNDLMAFGEHLGSPPAQGPYVSTGMRLVDDRLRNELNWRFSANQLEGFDSEYAGSELGPDCGVMHAQSHDNDYVDRKPLHHAMYFMRRGLGLVYSDGNNHAATLSGSGGAFPRWAQTDFLGQWNQKQIPTLLHAHENFARGGQWGRWSQGNFVAWQRGDGGDTGGMTMLFQLNSAWDWWEPTKVGGEDFPRDSLLYDYASDMYMPYYENSGPEAAYAKGYDIQDGHVNLPPNSYAIWSWKNPDPSGLYPSPYPDCFVNADDRVLAPDSRVITILEDGKVVEPVMVVRKDGVDGDPNFNPYGVADTNATDYAYTIAIPRVTGGTNVTLAVKVDGSAESIKVRLDGGMDFGNGVSNDQNGDWRDAPPGLVSDFWLGFEDVSKWFTRRIWSEKFAASNTTYCKIGTQGATTYEITPSATNVYQPESAYEGASIEAPGFVWHNPTAETESVPVAKVAVSKTAKPKAMPRASATWIGATYIFANAWYKGDGQGHDDWYPAAFQGANLGKVSGSISFGGQCQTYGESDGEGNPARACYNVLSGGSVVKTGQSTLYWYQYESNNNWFESRTGNSGTWLPVEIDVSDLDDGTYTLSVWFEADGNGQVNYDNNGGANYEATFTIGEGGGGGESSVQPQFTRDGTSATIWAKTSKEQGARTFLYYTVDGIHWPEGGGGVPANPATKAVEGTWKADSDSGSWWRFDLPEGSIPSGATLRYKISAFREMGYGGNGWGTIWPGELGDIANKKVMMSLWTIPGLDFTTQSYHKHLDYKSWTTGFEDGYHLVTARAFLGRSDGAAIANTFRQTFYLDRHTPDGFFLYPSEENPTFGDSEYGMVFKTDNTVDHVWVHITDSDDSNDGVGNGITTNGVVEWAPATQISPWTREMAQDTATTKIWRFPYTRVPSEGNATIRVRLCEVSSSPTNVWNQANPALDDLEALHVTELTKTVTTRGPAELFYFDWPSEDGTMVEAGWDVRLKFSRSMIDGVPTEDVPGKFRVYVNTTANGSTNRGELVAASELDLGPGDGHWWENDPSTVRFKMPNVYNGIDGWRYALTVEFENGEYAKSATRLIQHKGALLPTCIITTPPETDSDGVKWVITMEDSVAAATNRTLRETPIVVLTDSEATRLDLAFVSPTNYSASISATPTSWPTNDLLRLTNVTSNGTSMTWTFAWQVTNAGAYRFEARVTADNSAGKFSSPNNSAARSANVRFRQLVHVADTNDVDWDDDGILNERESDSIPLPEKQSEYWTQDEVFDWWSTGKSDTSCPDADGDGLPDALELGYRVAGDGTDASTDTNGDGWPNFIWDRDPPFFNSCESLSGKVPGVTSSTEGGDRTAIVKGSVTDPRNPDSDGDGIPDGVEDANRNGWTDGDGEIIGSDWDPWWDRAWPDGKMAGETWEETSPCIADSDADGLTDGYGEDKNLNGYTDMALLYQDGTLVPITSADYVALGIGIDNASSDNSSSTLTPKPYTSRAINYDALFAAFNVADSNGSGTKQTNGWPRLVITETDPLCTDTDHDGLPDGWEVQYGLDPLNNGVYDFRTGQFTDDPTHGPRGNPDGDTYIQGGETVPYDNAAELLGGTNPRSPDNGSSGGGEAPGSITIGAGDAIGEINGNQFFAEYTQWTLDDLVALDDYNQGGNSSDIYRCGDGFDSSRDMVAFYFRDGGDSASGGDDTLYFRVDFDDLKAFAEDNALNVYVAMNFGNYGNGITWLPDDVNCKTEMKWNAVSGVYDSQNGCLYVQKGTSEEFDSTGGFRGAYFNSELDTVAWSIDRKVLVDAGWNGMGDNLLFQVYTTRDFTNDDGGSGDKGGLNDFTDTIGDDWLCSDYWNDYNNIAQNGKFTTCVTKGNPNYGWNNRRAHAKLAIVAHGNQAVEPGSAMQALVDNGEGAGYQRPVKIHNIYANCPMNLHITPTLAMAMEWAEVGTDKTWYSGPAFNAAIREGIAKGAFALMGSTYSDHVIKYYPDAFNAANAALAEDTLNAIYGNGTNVVSTNVFWLSERVADANILQKLARMGYQATVVDQTPHILEWFGRATSLGNDAYKIHRYWAYDTEATRESGKGMKAFVLSSAADQFRFANTDNGLSSDLRHLFLRRARTGEAAISSIFYRWEDFTSSENADGYDRNVRWIANHPWIQVVTLDEALADNTLTNALVYKDLCATNGMGMQDWVHHACNGNYDYWYYGDAGRGNASRNLESLYAKQFEIRQGTNMATIYGDATNGIVKAAWNKVAAIANADVKRLAEATIFASAFETAFHDEDNNNLSRWSFGEYMYPATDYGKGLMPMAWKAQSRTRLAAVFSEVDDWAGRSTGLEAYAKDVDLDGENEYILRNDKVMALFEAEGGLMVGAWLKDGTNVWQMVGNFAAQPGSGYETQSAATGMHRGAAMKDITIGGTSTVTDIFTVTPGTGTLAFKKGDLTKTVELADAATGAFTVSYNASGKQMYVRNGLSPNLAALMIGGQARMSETAEAKSLAVSTVGGGRTVTATVDVTQGDINSAATDREDGWNTVNMRNAAQVRYVEVAGNGSLAYTLEFSAGEAPGPEFIPVDGADVEVPVEWLEEAGFSDEWLQENGYEEEGWAAIVKQPAANKAFTVWMCYVAGLDPTDSNATFEFESDDMKIEGGTISFTVEIPPERIGEVHYADSLSTNTQWKLGGSWANPGPGTITQTYSNNLSSSNNMLLDGRFYRKALRLME